MGAVLCAIAAVAASPASATCPNEAFRVGPSAALPECRAYEMVTPVDKGGQDAGFPSNEVSNTAPAAVAADGQRLSYLSSNAFPGATSFTRVLWFAKRGPDGWSATSGNPPPGQSAEAGFINPYITMGSSANQLAAGFLDRTTKTVPLSIEGETLWIVRADGTRDLVATSSASSIPAFKAISADGHHVLFTSADHLVPIPGEPNTEEHQLLYEWTDDGGVPVVRLVNVDDAGNLIGTGPAGLGGGKVGSEEGALWRNAVSRDGSRIFFQSPAAEPFSGKGGGPLYLREDGTHTVEVSAPEAGHGPAEEVQYLDAAEDGSKAFFWANGQLTDDAPPTGGIYRYDVGGGDLTWLADAPGPEVLALASVDGTRLYYGPGRNAFGSIKLNENGVDRLVFSEYKAVNPTAMAFTDSAESPAANLTPDGRFLTFVACVDFISCESMFIYRYDAATSELLEVTRFVEPTGGDLLLGESGRLGDRGRALTNDGTVFFTSRGALVPEDENNRRDVYGWRPGQTWLISGGSSPFDSSISGVSESGDDVFFTTAEQLVGADGDTNFDIYDARVGGGFPEPQTARSCQGEGCQGSSSSPPAYRPPASVNGAGNATPRRVKARCRQASGSQASRRADAGKRQKAKKARCANTRTKRKGQAR